MSGGRWFPESRVEITIDYGEEKIARAIAEAVSPDNIDAPEDIRVESLARGNHVLATVGGKTSLERVISTVEDLLSCIQAAERAIGALKGEKDKSLSLSNKSDSLERL